MSGSGILLLAILMGAEVELSNGACSSTCSSTKNGTEVVCRDICRANISQVIGDLPANITKLTITHSQFPKALLENSTFSNLTDLVYLELSENALESVDLCALCGLSNLKGLDVTRNKLAQSALTNLLYGLTSTVPRRQMDFLHFGEQDFVSPTASVIVEGSFFAAFGEMAVTFVDLTNMQMNNVDESAYVALKYLKNVLCFSIGFNNFDKNTVLLDVHNKHIWKLSNTVMLDFSRQDEIVPGAYSEEVILHRQYLKKECVRAINISIAPSCVANPDDLLPFPGFLLPVGLKIRLPRSGYTNMRTLLFSQPTITEGNSPYTFANNKQAVSNLTTIRLKAFTTLNYYFLQPLHGLECVEEIDVDYVNSLQFSEQTLTKIPNLKKVVINYNDLHYQLLKSPILKNNTKLEYLEANGNNLTVEMIEDYRSFLRGLPLKTLLLRDNNITRIPFNLIRNLTNLEELDLTDHLFQDINSEDMATLSTLMTNGNRLKVHLKGTFDYTCPCGSRELADWFLQHRQYIPDIESVHCTLHNGSSVPILQHTTTLPCSLDTGLVKAILMGVLIPLATVGVVVPSVILLVYRDELTRHINKNRRKKELAYGETHTLLVYSRSEGKLAKDIREALEREGMNYVDPFLAPPGSNKEQVFIAATKIAATVTILSSKKACEDGEFEEMCKKILKQYGGKNTFLLRPQNENLSACRTKTLQRLCRVFKKDVKVINVTENGCAVSQLIKKLRAATKDNTISGAAGVYVVQDEEEKIEDQEQESTM